MILKRQLHWILYILFALSCAKQTSPTGGPKDTIPPDLVRVIPRNNAINSKPEEIILRFSEMVQLSNPKEEFIISPSIGKNYKVEARNEEVTITPEVPWQDSTTYTFNFREGIQDVTEKNSGKNLQLAFSTGPWIDSLIISGTVTDVLSGEPAENYTVAATPATDTFSIFKHPSIHSTKTDESGRFAIENLKPGTYIVTAFRDNNKNRIADSKSEPYGFISAPVLLTQNLPSRKLKTTKLDARPLKVTSAKPYNTYFNIKTTKSIKEITIKATDNSDVYFHLSEPDNANILVYNNLRDRDSLQLQISATDSINNKLDTTLYAKFSEQNATPEKFNYSVKDPRLLVDAELLTFGIKFSKPLKTILFDSLLFQVDSANNIIFTKDDISYIEARRELTVRKKISKKLFPVKDENGRLSQEQTKSMVNRLTIGKGTFISIESDSSTATQENVTPQYLDNLGIIIAELPPNQPPALIQLVTETGMILLERFGTTATFNNLDPGNYMLRAVIDVNNNRRWDPGNYLLKQEPEEIIYWKDQTNKKTISLKENYELTLLISY